jgi:hypothetical protein
MPPFTLLVLTIMCGALVTLVDVLCNERQWTDSEVPRPARTTDSGGTTDAHGHGRPRPHDHPRN